MRRHLAKLLYSLPFLILLSVAAPADELGWKAYRDTIEKCQLDYPSSLFEAEAYDAASDIQRFAGPGASTYFRVRGVENAEGLSPADVRGKYLAADVPGDIVYERTKGEFLVLSGYRGSDIYYTKVALSPDRDTLCILEITYPRSDKAKFDAIVTRMSRSFRALPARQG